MMKNTTFLVAALSLGTALSFAISGALSQEPPSESVDLKIMKDVDIPASDQTTSDVVSASNAFLDTLSDDERDRAVYAFDDNAQRARWSNLPISLSERGGLLRGDLSDTQNAALDDLLETLLSDEGVRNANLQMAADDLLESQEAPVPLEFGSDKYTIAFVGKPAEDAPFLVQFGGHHLAINATFAGPKASFSPMLTGGQPLTVEVEGETVYITGEETKAAQALLDSLDETQKDAAVRSDETINLILGPGEYGTTVATEGVKGADLTDAQKGKLVAIVEARIGQLNERDARSVMEAVRSDIDATTFGWWGPQDQLGAAYFRITGPTIVQEYAPQHMGGSEVDVTEHSHAMYRDPTNDYGALWIGVAK